MAPGWTGKNVLLTLWTVITFNMMCVLELIVKEQQRNPCMKVPGVSAVREHSRESLALLGFGQNPNIAGASRVVY